MEGYRKNGFTIFELLVVIAIITILVTVSAPPLMKFYRIYKFNEYVNTVENLILLARLKALEQSVNVGVCVQDKTLTLYNMGSNRSNPCNGTPMGSLNVIEDFISISTSFGLGNSGTAFDPRGLAIFSGHFEVKNTVDNKCRRFCMQTLRGAITTGNCTNSGCS